MDSFELNKIAGAVLATALLVMVLSITSEMIYEPTDLRENGYVIAVNEGEGHGGTAEAAASTVAPIAVRLQTADVAAGQATAKKCQACHTLEKGGPAKVGPNLYGIVGNDAAHMPGFKYPDAMIQEHAAGMTWTFAQLDKFLTSPRADIPGTLMSFAGLKKPDDRANVIAYLRTLSDSPVPLPEPQPATALPPPSATSEVPSIAARLESADVKAGQATAKKCQACHTLEKGGPAKVGPNLYGIVGTDAAHMPGFKYSDAMMQEHAAGVTWTFAELDKFLTSPKAEVPGTRMSFAGLKKPEDRANVIAYLRTLSDSPVPLPEAQPTESTKK
jgi:cytochrome c